MKKLEIYAGDKFGNLEIISEIEKEGNMRVFNVKCVKCGIIKNIRINSLKTSKTGCLCTNSGWKIKPGSKKSILEKRMYCIYNGILQRCNNINYKEYKNYGLRGIKCEWVTFDEFYNDMKDYYITGLSIDRINNNGNYSKNNCRWVDDFVQANNKRNNIIVEGGITLKQWCNTNGFEIKSKYNRVYGYYKKGFCLEEIKIKMLKNNCKCSSKEEAKEKNRKNALARYYKIKEKLANKT